MNSTIINRERILLIVVSIPLEIHMCLMALLTEVALICISLIDKEVRDVFSTNVVVSYFFFSVFSSECWCILLIS